MAQHTTPCNLPVRTYILTTYQTKMASSSVPTVVLLVCILVVVVVVVVVMAVIRDNTNRQGKSKAHQQQMRHQQLSRKKRAKMQRTPKQHHPATPPKITTHLQTPLHSYYETRSSHHTPTPFPDVTVSPYAQTTNHAPHDTTTSDDTYEEGVSHVESPMATPCPRVNVWRREDWCGVFI